MNLRFEKIYFAVLLAIDVQSIDYDKDLRPALIAAGQILEVKPK
jgi:hypothetical protein